MAPLRPPEVTDKLVRAVEELAARGGLADLRPGPGLREAVQKQVARLPFHLRSTYGGNTTCVEVMTPDGLIILDCGSGLRELGIELDRRWNAPGYKGPRSANVLITHPHMDHTFGFPYASPYFDPRNHFSLWATRSVLSSLSAVLNPSAPLSHTYFPPSYDLMKALRDFHELQPGDEFSVGSTKVRTYALNHPGGCLAFRLENAGHVLVFATDHEQAVVPDPGLGAFAQGADLLYTEGQYLQTEYDGKTAVPGDAPLKRHNWGHSPMEACVATALAAGVRRLHVGHREPRRGDDQIAECERYMQRLAAEGLARLGRPADDSAVAIPYEGMTVHV